MSIAEIIKAITVFLRRIRHCAGFGIQSPTDYAFVREVIYERGEYSLYSDLDRGFPQAGRMERRLAHLLLRISNYAQASDIAIQDNMPEIFCHALRLGSKKSKMSSYKKDAEPATLTVFHDIQKRGKAEWNELLLQPHIVAYDLYYIGLAFYDKKRYTESYIINFY